MKKDIHPKYVECKVTCGCGNSFMTRSTVATLGVEVCSSCHPFFTGQQKFIDTAGRVEKFQKKYQWNAQQAVTKADEAAKAAAAKEAAKPKRKAPVVSAMPSIRIKAIKALEAAGAEAAGKGAPGGRPGMGGPGGGGGRGGPGGGPGGPGGGGGGRGGRGGGRGGRGKREAPVSTERQRTKPRAARPSQRSPSLP